MRMSGWLGMPSLDREDDSFCLTIVLGIPANHSQRSKVQNKVYPQQLARLRQRRLKISLANESSHSQDLAQN